MSAVQTLGGHAVRRHLAGIIGGTMAVAGQPQARHSYALGAACDPADGRFIVTLTEEVRDAGCEFERQGFSQGVP